MGLLNLLGRIDLNAKPFEAGLKGVRSSAAGLAKELGLVFGFSAVLAGSKKLVDLAGKFADLRDATGESAEALQGLEYGFSQAGSSAEDMAKALKEISKARAAALGGDKDKLAAFSGFGISRDTLVTTSSSAELLTKLSDALKNTTINANSLPAILELIGAKGGSAIPALVAGLRQSSEDAHRLGLVMKEDVVDQLDRVGDAAQRAGRSLLTLFSAPLATISTWIEHSATAWLGIFSGLSAAGKAVRAEFGGGGFVNPMKMFSGNYWNTFGDAFLKRFNEIRDGDATGGGRKRNIDAEALMRNESELSKIASDRQRLEENRRRFRLGELSDSEKLAELEKEKAQIAGLGLEKPSLAQELRMSALDLEIQQARRKGTASPLSDSLSQIGNFLGTDPSAKTIERLSRIEQYLRSIDDKTERRGAMPEFP